MNGNKDVSRRTVLRATGVTMASIGTLSIAGCTQDNDDLLDDGSYRNNDLDGDGVDEGDEGEQSSGSSNEGTPALGQSAGPNSLGYEIEYCCSWSGSLSFPSQSRSIEGTGRVTGRANPLPDYMGLTVQKHASGGDILTARIFYDGEVLNEGSTSAEYGVVSISVSR